MFTVNLLEEAAAGTGSIWVPVVVLGWFLVMTLVGWQVSRRNSVVSQTPQDVQAGHSGDNPSEFDTH